MNNHKRTSAWDFSRAIASILVTACVAIAICAMVMGADAAHAAEPASSADDTGSIQLEYDYQGEALEGATVDLYRVADWRDGTFSLNAAFSGVRFGTDRGGWNSLMKDLNDGKATADQFQEAAWMLDAYTASSGIKPDAQGTITAAGMEFSNLAKGLYLVVYNHFADGDKTCGASASLVSIPSVTQEGESLSRVTVRSKSECATISKTNLNVVKVWKGDERKNRPTSIEVQLLRDGTVADTVTLSAANNWRHAWSNLATDHEWRVIEKNVPDGYVMALSRNGSDFTLINTSVEQAHTGANVALIAVGAIVVAVVGLLVLRMAKTGHAEVR